MWPVLCPSLYFSSVASVHLHQCNSTLLLLPYLWPCFAIRTVKATTENISILERDSHGTVTVDSCIIEIILLTYLFIYTNTCSLQYFCTPTAVEVNTSLSYAVVMQFQSTTFTGKQESQHLNMSALDNISQTYLNISPFTEGYCSLLNFSAYETKYSKKLLPSKLKKVQ